MLVCLLVLDLFILFLRNLCRTDCIAGLSFGSNYIILDVCGFFFRDEPTYTPTADLESFLKQNPTPVYIGFGSIVIDEPDKLTTMIVNAIDATGVAAIISRGWSELGGGQTPRGNIFYLDDCPHEWLFKHVSAVVHHGGAGTTACGLLHGRPTAIVPFFGE